MFGACVGDQIDRAGHFASGEKVLCVSGDGYGCGYVFWRYVGYIRVEGDYCLNSGFDHRNSVAVCSVDGARTILCMLKDGEGPHMEIWSYVRYT